MQEFIEVSHSLSEKITLDFAIHNIGYEDCPSGYQYGPRVCPYHLIHFVTKGCGTLHMQDVDLPVQAGEAFLIPMEKIAWYRASEEDPWSYSWIGFLGTQADAHFRRLMSRTDSKYVLTGLDTAKYHSLIKEGAHLDETDTSRFFLANSILLRIFSELYADLGEERKMEDSNVIADEIRYYLEMKYSEKLQMNDVAQAFHIHPNYLTRIFRERFAMTPKRYFVRLKMEKACRLLKETQLPVSMISDALGFDDPLAFSKRFHGIYGISPTGYRR